MEEAIYFLLNEKTEGWNDPRERNQSIFVMRETEVREAREILKENTELIINAIAEIIHRKIMAHATNIIS